MNIEDFAKMREKYVLNASEVRQNNYERIFVNMLSGMFDITDSTGNKLPFSQHELMLNIAYNGICGIYKDGENFVLTHGKYYGVPKPSEEFPPRYIGVRPNFQIDTDTNDKNLVIAYCFPDRLPDFNIYWFSEQLTEVDKSLYNNLIFSRIAPIAVIGRENEREAYIDCVEKMVAGELINSITSVTNPIDGTPADIIKTIDITDGKYSEKIQYLSRYHEDLIRRIAMLYGHSMATTSKSANLLKDEVNSTETVSKIYPEIMLGCMNEWLSEFNEKFGYTYSATFSKPWEHLNEPAKIEEETKEEKESTEETENSEETESEVEENV